MKTVIDQGGGVQTVVAVEDGNLITGTVQDFTAILEDAKSRHNSGVHGTKEVKHAARLPILAVETYCNANGITFEEWMHNPVHVKAMLNDPNLRDLRIWPGRV